MLFWGQVAGVLDAPRGTIEGAILGYENYNRMSKDEQERALWNSFTVELGRLKNKTIPAVREGIGVSGIAMQELSLYPNNFTRDWRSRVNKYTKKATGMQPFVPREPKQVKPNPVKGFYPTADEIYGAPINRANQGLKDLSSYITSLK